MNAILSNVLYFQLYLIGSRFSQFYAKSFTTVWTCLRNCFVVVLVVVAIFKTKANIAPNSIALN